MKVLRKLGIPAAVLAGMLVFFTPSSANARVRFGVQIGGPVYTYPYYPAPYYPYGPYYGYGYHVYYHHHHHFRRWR